MGGAAAQQAILVIRSSASRHYGNAVHPDVSKALGQESAVTSEEISAAAKINGRAGKPFHKLILVAAATPATNDHVLARLRQTFKNHIYAPVIQFGPVRTGSTLVWNALTCFYPNSYIPKRHQLSPVMRMRNNPVRIVATVRDPRDVVVSMLRVAGEEPARQSVIQQLDLLARNGLRDLEIIADRERLLVLRYEDIYQNGTVLFRELETFLGKSCTPEVQDQFAKRFAIDVIRERGCRMGTFDRFDPVDQIHGQHVSESMGRPGGYHEHLSQELQEIVTSRCRSLMERYSYLP